MTHSVMLYVNLARFAYVSLEGFACFSMLVASKRASGSTLPALECFQTHSSAGRVRPEAL